MGVKFLASMKFLVRLLIVTGWFWLLVELAAVNVWSFLAVFGLLAADYWLWLRGSDLDDPPLFFEWFPVGAGFYCWWMMRKPQKEKRGVEGMGIRFWASVLVRLVILVALCWAIMKIPREYSWLAAIVCFLSALDATLYFRTPFAERTRYAWQWCPLGDGFYMWWKTRNRGGSKWTI